MDPRAREELYRRVHASARIRRQMEEEQEQGGGGGGEREEGGTEGLSRGDRVAEEQQSGDGGQKEQAAAAATTAGGGNADTDKKSRESLAVVVDQMNQQQDSTPPPTTPTPQGGGGPVQQQAGEESTAAAKLTEEEEDATTPAATATPATATEGGPVVVMATPALAVQLALDYKSDELHMDEYDNQEDEEENDDSKPPAEGDATTPTLMKGVGGGSAAVTTNTSRPVGMGRTSRAISASSRRAERVARKMQEQQQSSSGTHGSKSSSRGGSNNYRRTLSSPATTRRIPGDDMVPSSTRARRRLPTSDTKATDSTGTPPQTNNNNNEQEHFGPLRPSRQVSKEREATTPILQRHHTIGTFHQENNNNNNNNSYATAAATRGRGGGGGGGGFRDSNLISSTRSAPGAYRESGRSLRLSAASLSASTRNYLNLNIDEEGQEQQQEQNNISSYSSPPQSPTINIGNHDDEEQPPQDSTSTTLDPPVSPGANIRDSSTSRRDSSSRRNSDTNCEDDEEEEELTMAHPINTVSAQLVLDDDISLDFTEMQFTTATAVSVDDRAMRFKALKWIVIGIIALAIIITTTVAISINNQNNNSIPTTTTTNETTTTTGDDDTTIISSSINLNRPTLDIVRERGYVICGTFEKGRLRGLNEEQCRCMAYLALGDPNRYTLKWSQVGTRFQMLANGTVDMLAESDSFTMERDIFETTQTSLPFSFSTPYFYDGLTFGGIPSFVDCAQALDSFKGHCRSLKICVLGPSTTHAYTLEKILKAGVLVMVPDLVEMQAKVEAGACQVVATQSMGHATVKPWFTEWKMSKRLFSKEPLAVMTRQGDPTWSALANLVIEFLFLAEAQGFSKQNITLATNITSGSTNRIDNNKNNYSLGSNISNVSTMYSSLVAEIGSFGDIYLSKIEQKVPRNNLNRVYNSSHSSGLLWALPFGRLEEGKGPGPKANGTLETILKRGHLNCGVYPSKGAGFVQKQQEQDNATGNGMEENWSGFDVTFCEGLAASIFAGDKSKAAIVEIQDDRASTYHALATESVDVIAGSRVTLEATFVGDEDSQVTQTRGSDSHHQTGGGYSFSALYYYDNDSLDGYAFMSTQVDAQWNDFIYWIPMAMIYAEENQISSTNAEEMPVVELFGDNFKQMFMDCIFAVGNYAEVYNRTLQSVIPRTGANILHQDVPGPLQYAPPLL